MGMPMLVGDILRRQGRINSKKIGLIDRDRKFTYQEINERANRLGNALLSLGMKKGDKVAFMANNCHEFAEAYFAVAKIGLIIVPVNARFNTQEVIYTLNNSESEVFIYQGEFDEIVRKATPSLKTLKHFIKIISAEDNVQSYEALLSSNSPKEPEVQVDIDDVAMIMYTSGATGESKGVITTHSNLMATTNSMTLETRIVPEDINLLVMPMFHAGGLWPILTHFYRAARTIILPHFDVDIVLQMIEQERVTFLNLVPTTLRRLAIHPDLKKYDLDSLRLIMYAGAPIPLHQLKEAMSIFGPHRFHTGLGATEAGCGGMLSFPAAEHALTLDGPLASKLGSVGRDSIGAEVKIVDENGTELPAGKVGEIIARGDEIAIGYWKMPGETADTFKDGWLYTGDLGYRDEDCYVFIVGRRKDIIISGGENISSLEVEEVISQHPGIVEVAVIGVPNELWGEVVKAVVVLKPEYQSKVTEQEIINFSRERLAAYKSPKSVDFLAELPKNQAGKIKKGELKERYRH
jgi:acyl-CoA synthetase (AMP-forming)/AMP-acid ligase II